MFLRAPTLLFLAAACAATSLPAHAQQTADTRRVDTVEHAFGLDMPDPYRWMEGEGNAEFDAWLRARGTETRKTLDALPSLAAWRERLGKVAGATRTHGGHVQVGDRLFFRRLEAGKEAVLMWRDAAGAEHVLFDPATQQGKATIHNYSVSPDGKRVTINVGRGGNEISQVEVYDVDTGKPLGDVLAPVWSEFNPSWLPDGSGFAYTRMDPSRKDDPLQGMGAYLHILGEPQPQDRLLARADGGGALAIAPESFPSIDLPADSDWAILTASGARQSARTCVAPRADVVAGKATWRCLADFGDNIVNGTLRGDTAYLVQTSDTPFGRVLALDLRNPTATLADATVAIPERVGMAITGIGASADGLYLKTMRDGIDHLEFTDTNTDALQPIALPLQGTIGRFWTDPGQAGAIVSLEDWTTPATYYRIVHGAPAVDLRLGESSPADYAGLVAEETEATSADGTRVPLSIVHRKGLAKDGRALAFVEAYGGYGMSTQPNFFPMILEWAQAGHVYAHCHVRGGGEKGDAWRLGGAGPNKQRGVEDFIACARALAERGYTTSARTAGFGASMGGIVLGGAYVTEPSAFGVIAMNAPILNPTRLLAAKNGANQIAELGDPRTADGMKQLLAMDPYQRVRDGVRYPLLFVNVGVADQRVAPWNTGKFAARVAQASPGTRIWLRTEDGLGHFPTSYSAFALVFADFYAGLESALGEAAQ